MQVYVCVFSKPTYKNYIQIYTHKHKLHTDVDTDTFSIVNHIKFPLPEQILLTAHQNLGSLENCTIILEDIQFWKCECADLNTNACALKSMH